MKEYDIDAARERHRISDKPRKTYSNMRAKKKETNIKESLVPFKIVKEEQKPVDET